MRTTYLALAVILVASSIALPARADDIAEAREHFRKGSNAFDLGHYQEAIKEYEAAYRIKDDAALLFNIGQAYRLQGDNQNAIRAYKSFLHRMPDASNRAEVERRIEELQKAIDQEGRAKEGPPEGTLSPNSPAPNTQVPPPIVPVSPTETTTPTAQVDEHAARTKKIAGLVVAGVGVATLAVGGVFAGLAVKAGDDLTRLDQTMGTFDSSKQSAGKTDQIVEGVCFGVGGAAIVAGVIVYVLGHREAKSSRSRMAVAPFVAPTRAGITTMVRF